MGKPTGFMEKGRRTPDRVPIAERVGNYREFYRSWTEQQAREQGGRCMNCAVPFCHQGCPLGNLIPDWNDLVYRGQWQDALEALHATNNFPEFTGRICPAPCEASCVLAINQDPVTIEHIEKAISDRGWENGWIVPRPPEGRTGKRVAVVGSGPAGLAAAQQLNRAGHHVTVFERAERIGGLLSLGIPDFKLEKHIVQRRVDQMSEEGVKFKTGVHVGRTMPISDLTSEFDAVCLTGGSTVPRDLHVPNRDLGGIHFAMDYLTQQNRLMAGDHIPAGGAHHRRGQAGPHSRWRRHRGRLPRHSPQAGRRGRAPAGDTAGASDGADSRQPLARMAEDSHVVGSPRGGRHTRLQHPDQALLRHRRRGQKAPRRSPGVGPARSVGPSSMNEVPRSEFEIETELVLLAMGFLRPEHDGMLADLGVDLDRRGNVATDENKMSSVPSVFAAGDMARGQSLVVWALAEGREAARGIDQYLMAGTSLPRVLTSA